MAWPTERHRGMREHFPRPAAMHNYASWSTEGQIESVAAPREQESTRRLQKAPDAGW